MAIVLFLIEHYIVVRTVRLLGVLLGGVLVDHVLVHSLKVFKLFFLPVDRLRNLVAFVRQPILFSQVLVEVEGF